MFSPIIFYAHTQTYWDSLIQLVTCNTLSLQGKLFNRDMKHKLFITKCPPEHKEKPTHCTADECLVWSNDAANPCWNSLHCSASMADWVELGTMQRLSPLDRRESFVCTQHIVGSCSWSKWCWMQFFMWGMRDADPVTLCGDPSEFGFQGHTNKFIWVQEITISIFLYFPFVSGHKGDSSNYYWANISRGPL